MEIQKQGFHQSMYIKDKDGNLIGDEVNTSVKCLMKLQKNKQMVIHEEEEQVEEPTKELR